TTPPVTKMYFVATSTVLSLGRVRPLLGPLPHQRRLVRSRARPVVEPRVPKPAEHEPDRRPPRHAERDELLAAQGAPNPGGASAASSSGGVARPRRRSQSRAPGSPPSRARVTRENRSRGSRSRKAPAAPRRARATAGGASSSTRSISAATRAPESAGYGARRR